MKTIGMRFGRLVITAKTRKAPNTLWECLCDCGATKLVRDTNLGRTTNSCGCIKQERFKAGWAKNPVVPIFSEEDQDLLQFKWSPGPGGYAWRSLADGKDRFAHHDVIIRMYGRKPVRENGEVTDHKNRNKLDNRRENLHIVSFSENARNWTRTHGRHWSKHRGKYQASIRVDGKLRYAGQFNTPEEARSAALKLRESLTPHP